MKKVTVIIIMIAVIFVASSCKPDDINSNLSSVDGAQLSTLEEDSTTETDATTGAESNKMVMPSAEEMDTFLKGEVDASIKMTFYPSDPHFSDGLSSSETRKSTIGYILDNQYYIATVSITNKKGELYISDLKTEISHSDIQYLINQFSEIYLEQGARKLLDFGPSIEEVDLTRVDFDGLKISEQGVLSYSLYFESEFKLASNYEPSIAGNIQPIQDREGWYRQVGFAVMQVEKDNYTIESIGTSP